MHEPIRVCYLGLRHDRPANLAGLLCEAIRPGFTPRDVGRYFLTLRDQAARLWRSVQPELAQVVFYPHRYEMGLDVARVAQEAKALDVPCLFFLSSGPHDAHAAWAPPPPLGLLCRDVTPRAQMSLCDLAMPPLIDDPLFYQTSGSIDVRPKRSRAVVGALTRGGSFSSKLVSKLQSGADEAHSSELARQAIASVRQAKELDLRHIQAPEIFTTPPARGRAWDYEEAVGPYARLLDVLFGSEYVLCPPDGPARSSRLFQALAAGRIPVLLDTGLALPFEHAIDWSSRAVIVPADQAARCGELIAAFHAAQSPERFEELQIENRHLWESTLSPVGFLTSAMRYAIDLARGPMGALLRTPGSPTSSPARRPASELEPKPVTPVTPVAPDGMSNPAEDALIP